MTVPAGESAKCCVVVAVCDATGMAIAQVATGARSEMNISRVGTAC